MSHLEFTKMKAPTKQETKKTSAPTRNVRTDAQHGWHNGK